MAAALVIDKPASKASAIHEVSLIAVSLRHGAAQVVRI